MGNRVTSPQLIKLGNRIRKRRQAMQISQETLAERVGISVNSVSRIEGGQMAMSVETFQKLVQVLEADANQLLDGGHPLLDNNVTFEKMVFRYSHLDTGEQEIVRQTMGMLINELERNR